MKCEECQKKILEDGVESVSEHLKECPECLEFAKFANQAIEIQREEMISLEPSAILDAKIKYYAKGKCNPIRKNAFVFKREFIAFSLAASVMIVVGAVIFLNRHDSKLNFGENTEIVKNSDTMHKGSHLRWDKLDMEDEIFELIADILLSKELLSYSASEITPQDYAHELENFEFEIPLQLKI